MVHIIIKIDGTEAAMTTRVGETASAVQGPEAPAAEVLLAAASASGALDAGAAPTGAPPTTGVVPPPPSTVAGAHTPGAGTGDLAAGPAPGAQVEPPPSVVTEDGE